MDAEGVTMTSSETSAGRPGVIVGPTSEFSLFFRVKAGKRGGTASRLEGSAGHARVPTGRLRHGHVNHS